MLIENLLYFNNNERSLRLYIFIIIKEEIFKFVYYKIKYFKYIRIYKKFTEKLYILIFIKLYKFIRYYSHY